MFNNMPLLASRRFIFNKVDGTQRQLDKSSCEVLGVRSSSSDPDSTRGSVKPNPSLIQPPLGLLAVCHSVCVCVYVVVGVQRGLAVAHCQLMNPPAAPGCSVKQ